MTRAAALVVAAAALAACHNKRDFLGEPMPRACSRFDASTAAGERCIGWVFDRMSVHSLDEEYDDPALRAYVEGVARRIARASQLRPPTVRILDGGGSLAHARPGRYLYVSRELLPLLDNEAELAGVIAHEMVHDLAGHTADLVEAHPVGDGDDKLKEARQRDDEATADERAVELIARAGYAPDAMRTALVALGRASATAQKHALDKVATRAPGALEPDAVSGAAPLAPPETPIDRRHAARPRIGDDEDPTHPRMDTRIARVTRVIAGRTDGELAAARYRAHVQGIVVGDDPRRGELLGSTWRSARLGLAMTFPARWTVEGGGHSVEAYASHGPAPRGSRSWTVAYGWSDQTYGARLSAIGRPWGDVVVETLDQRRRTRIAGLEAVVGVQGTTKRDESGKQKRRLPVTAAGPSPEVGNAVAVVFAGDRAVALYVHGPRPLGALEELLHGFRRLRSDELATMTPARLVYRTAPVAGTTGELVTRLCPLPALAAWLDDPARRVDAGAAIRCVEK